MAPNLMAKHDRHTWGYQDTLVSYYYYYYLLLTSNYLNFEAYSAGKKELILNHI